MKKLQLFNVAPLIPEPIRFLEVLANNYWWSWHRNAIDLFQRMHPQLWDESGRNPLRFLGRIPQDRFEVLAEDKAFLAHLADVETAFKEQVDPGSPDLATFNKSRYMAYFSLEYGIHESLRIYSGGLGVLSGDHLKAASDLDLPLFAVGLFYRQGYFCQFLNRDGWQQEEYLENHVDQLPLTRVRVEGEDRDLVIEVPLPEGPLKAVVWRLNVGRIPLYLLDANIPENPPELRKITAQLYGGDRRNRLRQEILLGIGGYEAVLRMGYNPKVCHINEGHAGLTSLERISRMMKSTGLSLEAVLEIVQRSSIFTTHTPVPAGNETFPLDLLRPHLDALQERLGLDIDRVLSWGMPDKHGVQEEFSMTVFALRMAHHSNGVSRLHGEVARDMWRHLWPGRSRDEVPITHVTNGVHVPSWVSSEHAALYARYLGPQWHQHPTDKDVLSHVDEIPDGDLWRAHESGRARLISVARERALTQCRGRNATRNEMEDAKNVLNPDVLTIGFARRFATYKRATLLLRDPERFEAILTDAKRPVQFIVAGKAHPADDHGKAFIREIVAFSRRSNVVGRVLFLENYDISMARALVQGVDVWLNNPRRPHEASGTSGMKACLNGALHLSTLDGWWCEGYSPDCGWAIGQGEEYEEEEHQDSVESLALYNILENEVIPTFYEERIGGAPAGWLKMMKASIRMALGMFSSRRMLQEYRERFYEPCSASFDELLQGDAEKAKALLAQHGRLGTLWSHVKLDAPVTDRVVPDIHVGASFEVKTRVTLGELTPEEVDVQIYYGPVTSTNEIMTSHITSMEIEKEEEHGVYVYRQSIGCDEAGRFGLTTRVVPAGTDWQSLMPGFLTWADGAA